MDSVGFYGLRLRDNDEGLQIGGTVFANSPLYAAGLEEGDYILALNDTTIGTKAHWDQAVAELKIGQTCQLRFKQNGVETTGTFVATYDPSFSVVLLPEKDIKGKVKKRQEAWLSSGIE